MSWLAYNATLDDLSPETWSVTNGVVTLKGYTRGYAEYIAAGLNAQGAL